MPFSFLNPWLLLGALALAAPVWLHLRRKQETNLFRNFANQIRSGHLNDAWPDLNLARRIAQLPPTDL